MKIKEKILAIYGLITCRQYFEILHFDFPSQNAVNAEKSFEALLSHVISELSKDKSVYKVNVEETLMVRHKLLFSTSE